MGAGASTARAFPLEMPESREEALHSKEFEDHAKRTILDAYERSSTLEEIEGQLRDLERLLGSLSEEHSEKK